MVFGDFVLRPPELISAQIYSGPGAEPLLAAAAGWEALAAALHSTASSYGSVISGLVSDGWEGPSSASMAAAAAPYTTWLSTTADQAEQTAAQARAAASAYEAALAATVPPTAVAANRSQLAALQATNIFGQNGAAIAATEAEYGQMWAQDVAAISSYASTSEEASQLTPFKKAPATTNNTSNATPAATAASTSSTSSTTSTSSWLTQLENYINSLTKQYTQSWENLLGGTGNSKIAPAWEQLYSSIKGISGQVTWANTAGASFSTGVPVWKSSYLYAPWTAGLSKASLGAGLTSPGRLAAGISTQPVSAVLGNAPTVGKLSVPSNWATAAPAIRLSSNALPTTDVAAAPAAGFPGGLVNESTLGSLAGGALGSPAARVVSSTGIQNRSIAGERRAGPVKLDRIIAQLQEMPDQVQHWNVDEAGLDDLVAKLRTTPGVHAVHVSDESAATAAQPETQSG
ncbi:PPE family protein [Mycobacterium arosiense]|uniref:PPE family protein n=1 Tax=Mycobacterium arosiense ATCC BAA-1401 = DSM 45069 TaxID=1265311 RepID=A0A1W9ZIX8_MYCAI|nr:PPE family protein [Mycobacterium arosiense]ORA16029.1 PPE family protein [Mycobacterium arosiense ATCC BAA-1401 = DSM 45069]